LDKLSDFIVNFRTTFDEFKLILDYLATAGEEFIDPFYQYDPNWKGLVFKTPHPEIIDSINLDNVKNITLNHFFVSIYSYMDGLIDNIYGGNIFSSNIIRNSFLRDFYKNLEISRSEFKKKNTNHSKRFSDTYFKYDYLLKPEYNKYIMDYSDIEDDYLYFQKNRKIRNQIVHKKIIGKPYFVDENKFYENTISAEKIGIKLIVNAISYNVKVNK
jgi:hypothetical protein